MYHRLNVLDRLILPSTIFERLCGVYTLNSIYYCESTRNLTLGETKTKNPTLKKKKNNMTRLTLAEHEHEHKASGNKKEETCASITSR